MFSRLKVIRDVFNFNPLVIYDIGAFEGIWTKDCKHVWPNSVYFQFEANTEKAPFLKDNPTIAVLGNKDHDIVSYYRTKFAVDTGNSILKENSNVFEGENLFEEKREMRTLDSIIAEKGLPAPDFMKLDTQGSELIILEGASRCLESVQILMLEVSLHKLNENAPQIYEVLDFMKKRGFVMLDIADTNYQSSILMQFDLVFCKENSKFKFTRLKIV